MPDTPTGGDSGHSLAFYLGSDTCRLPIQFIRRSPRLQSLFFLPTPYFQSSKRSLIDAEKISFALLSGAALLAFNL